MVAAEPAMPLLLLVEPTYERDPYPFKNECCASVGPECRYGSRPCRGGCG